MPEGQSSALVLEKPKQLTRQEFKLPELQGNDAVVRVEACGLCGTDHEQYTGALPAGFAFIPGHEAVGVIEAAGDEFRERHQVAVGDRVAVEVFQSCRECPACDAHEYRRCERHGLANMYGFIPADKAPGLWGGYAEYQYLGPDCMLHHVPDSLDPVLATIFNPLGAGVRWGVHVPGTSAGDKVAVQGPGIRGLSALVAAKEAGADFVAVTGYGPNDAPRLAMAEKFGADLTVDVAVEDPAAAFKKATGGLADIVVDVSAKAPAAFAQSVWLARPAGTIVRAGTTGAAASPELWPDAIVFKELNIIGALGVDDTAYAEALAILASGKYPFDELTRETAGFDGLEDLLIRMSGEAPDAAPPPVHGVFVP